MFGSTPQEFVLRGDTFNPVVLTDIEQPNGAKHKFSYNIYGIIEKISYPTGGEEHFVHNAVLPLTPGENGNVSDQTNFGVTNRKIYETAGAGTPIEWNYSTATVNPSGYKITVTAPNNTKNERILYQSNPPCTGCSQGTFGYDNGLAGMAYEENNLSSTGQVLTKKLTSWTKTTLPVSNGSYTFANIADWHPRVIKEESIIYDPTTNNQLSATTTTDYDGDLSQRTTALNVKTTKQYGFTTTVGSLGALQKSIETTYLDDATYAANNLRSLPTLVQTKDANQVVTAQTQSFYDEEGYSGGVRGQVTRRRSWTSLENNLFIETRSKYDAYGNITESTDANGNVTATTFDGIYHAFPQQITTPIPGDGTHGSLSAFVVTATFDPTTGLPMTTTDANGVKTSTEYDSMLRPIRVSSSINTSTGEQAIGSQTLTDYGAPNEITGQFDASHRFVHTKTQLDATNWAEAWQWADGLGRTVKTQKKDRAGDVFVFTFYDQM